LGRVFSCSVSADQDELPQQFDEAAVGGFPQSADDVIDCRHSKTRCGDNEPRHVASFSSHGIGPLRRRRPVTTPSRTLGWSKSHRNRLKGPGSATKRGKWSKIALVVSIVSFSGWPSSRSALSLDEIEGSRRSKSEDLLLEQTGFEPPRPLTSSPSQN
jgi:hypothetical protein